MLGKYAVVKCVECGYHDGEAEKIPRRCPECGVEGWTEWREKVFFEDSKEVSE